MTRPSDVSDGEMTQFKSLLTKGGLTGEDILYVNADRNGDRAKIMVEALRAQREREARLAVTFENEEVVSSIGYPDGWQIKSLGEQASILVQCFPGLDVSYVDELATRYYPLDKRLALSKGMEGLVVVPKPSAIARLAFERSKEQKEEMQNWPAENLSLWELLRVVYMYMTWSKFYNFTQRNLGPKRYKLTDKTKEAYAAFDDLPGDVMVLAVQTGFLHRGKSVRRARFVFGEHEFGLCAFAVGIILLTHPERLVYVNHLWIDCAGSEFAPTDSDFSYCPYWGFNGDEFEFGANRISGHVPGYGSASGASPVRPA